MGFTQLIPQKVINSCKDHFYELDIVDTEIIEAKNGNHLEPIYFSMDMLNFATFFYPNGNSEETKGKIDWVLRLLSLPTSIREITIEFTVILLEKNECYTSNVTFDQTKLTANYRDFMPREDIINCKQLTFKISSKILELKDHRDQLITNQNLDINKQINSINPSFFPSASLIWSTEDKKLLKIMKKYSLGNYKTTNIFDVKSLKFLIKIYPNGSYGGDVGKFCIELILMTIPPKLSGICVVLDTRIMSKGFVGPLRQTFGSFNVFNCNNEDGMSILCENICTFDEFQKFDDGFSLNLIVKFVQVFDMYGQSVLSKFDNNKNDCRPLKLPTKYQRWSPNNTSEILDAPNTKFFQSKIFELEGFKWMIEIYPNGFTPSHERQLAAFLYLTCLSPKISKIAALIRLRVFGEGIHSKLSYSFLDTGEYSIHNTKLGWITTGISDLAYLSGIEQLKFECTVLIIDVFDENGNSIWNDDGNNITKYQKFSSPLAHTLNTKMGSRTWKIHNKAAIKMLCDSEYDESFESGFFSINKLKWNIKLYPNGKQHTQFEKGDVVLQIQLQELIKPMIGLSFMYRFYIKETGTWFSNIAHFRTSNDNWNNLRDNWSLSHLKLEKLRSIKKLTIKLELKVLEVYAIHNILMTHVY